jgi:tRNA A37 threonylcarbamoyladenosine synthetase subunit TsaC/SUA5/YrdC
LLQLLELQGTPLLSTSLIPPDETEPLNDAQAIRERFEHQIAAVLDAGACRMQATTVVDLTPMGTGGDPLLIREGAGDVTLLGL